MEKFFQSVIVALSFILIVVFCRPDNTKPVTENRYVAEPVLESVEFEQIPAVVNLEGKNEDKFNWKTPKRH